MKKKLKKLSIYEFIADNKKSVVVIAKNAEDAYLKAKSTFSGKLELHNKKKLKSLTYPYLVQVSVLPF